MDLKDKEDILYVFFYWASEKVIEEKIILY